MRLVDKIVRYLVLELVSGHVGPVTVHETQAQVDAHLEDWARGAGYWDYDEYLAGPSNGHDIRWYEVVVHGPVAVQARLTVA